ncbi:hypothetical protein QW131_05860 [Roseibium salinum]|nr:hypothetical protein [Roseibium salinum]
MLTIARGCSALSFFRNLHVFVFLQSFSLLAALLVANGPHKAVNLMRPLVEDAVEVRDLTVAAYREIRQLSLHVVSDEAVSLYIATLRMPSMLFERLADRLAEVEKKVSMSPQVEPAGQADAQKATRLPRESRAMAAGDLRKRRL